MSYNPYSSYSHDTYYGNNDGAYCLSDGAYYSNTGHNNYLGDNHDDTGYEEPPTSSYPELHPGYDEALTRRAAEAGMTPRELHELNLECIREQEQWEREENERREDEARRTAEVHRAREQEERERMEQEELEGYSEVHPGTPAHPTSFQPEQEPYEAHEMADSPHDAATSPECHARPNNDHERPDHGYPLSGYNDEGNAYADTPNPFANHERDPYEVPGPHDDTTSFGDGGLLNAGTQGFELGDPSPDQERPLTHREWIVEGHLGAEL